MSCDFSDCKMNKNGFHISSRNKFFYEASFYVLSVISMLHKVREIKTLFHFSQSFLPSIFFPFINFLQSVSCPIYVSLKAICGSYKLSEDASQPSSPCCCRLVIFVFPHHNFKSCVDSVPLHARSSHKYLLLRIPFFWDMTLHQWVLDPDVLRQ